MEETRVGGHAGGPTAAPMARECSFTRFMKCGPTQFHGTKGAVRLVHWFEKMVKTFEISECAKGKKVKYATATLHGRALTFWNSQVATLGLEMANGRPWTEVKQMMIDEFCPNEKVQWLEDELRHLKLRDMNIAAYTKRFNELGLLCPDVIPSEKKKVKLYIKGLPEIIKGERTSSRPATLNEAVRMAHALMEQKIQAKNERIAEGIKRKWENNNQGNNSHNRGNYRNNNHHNQNNNRRHGNTRALTTSQNAGANQTGIAPNAKDYRRKNVASGAVVQPNVVCYECRERGHKSRVCPKKADRRGGNVQGQAYVIRDAKHNQGPNVVTGTFLLNNRYVTMLFDSGADKSFVDIKISHLIDIKPVKLNSSYEVKLANRKVVSTNSVSSGCTLNLLDHLFDNDLMPIELGTFDVIVGMDWLVERDALIVYGKKEVHVPYKNKTLVVKTQVTEKEPAKKQLQDVPVICNFLKVFLDDLPGLPPPRQVKFKIELIPGVTPVTLAPYRLAPSKLKELEEVIPITVFQNRYGHFEFQMMSFGLTNALALFIDLMNRMYKPYLDKFVIMFIDDILIYSKNKEDHEKHLKIIMKLLKNETLYENFSKCNFWLESVQFLGHVIDGNGVHKNKKYEWGMEEDEKAFQTLKQKLCSAPILALPEGTKNFIVYCDESLKGFGTPEKILEAHTKVMKEENVKAENLGSWDRYLPLVEFSYNNSYHASIKAVPFEALYGQKCRSPVCWSEVGDSQLIGPELIRETTEKIVQISNRLLTARSRQKSYVDVRRKPMESEVGDMVMLKVLPWKGVFRLGNMKRLADENLVIPLEEIQLDDKLHFIEEPIEIMDREVKQLKKSQITIVKVRWNSRRGPEYTWEREYFFTTTLTCS
uniref:CCHC-type domain-containing protein n=1 Tax=Tanacetum cinerariifolium TaxID=118510 RepID=A0A699GWB5_TANCI|nr:hypothetical protein [Tanacetum cinerariifolium]